MTAVQENIFILFDISLLCRKDFARGKFEAYALLDTALLLYFHKRKVLVFGLQPLQEFTKIIQISGNPMLESVKGACVFWISMARICPRALITRNCDAFGILDDHRVVFFFRNVIGALHSLHALVRS